MANILFLAIMFIFSVGYTILSFKLPFGTFSMPGPGMIPLISGLMAIFLSATLLLLDLRKMKGVRAKPTDTAEEATEKSAYPLRILWFLIAFIIYILIFKPIGYVISTMLFTIVLFKIMENKWSTSIFAGVATSFAFFVVFSLLAVPLPKGILSGLKFF